MELQRIVEGLTQPSAYPHPGDRVEVIHTHISVVFLVGDRVYKIKKPVDLGFCDFTTLELRLHFCQEEVRLNRRLAPEVYLGVAPIGQVPGGLRIGDTNDTDNADDTVDAIEWAVVMRRLPADRTLLAQLQANGAGAVDAARIGDLAQRVAGFHDAAERSARIDADASLDSVTNTILAVLDRARDQAPAIVDTELLEEIRRHFADELERHGDRISRRARDGLARDCHGDLHLSHIYTFADRPPPDDIAIIDCIEFNPSLRHLDPIADLAFLRMDLLYYHHPELAEALTTAYLTARNDTGGAELLPLYTAYRSAVRAMVHGIRAGETEVPADERRQALAAARSHWLLALGQLASPQRRPCLVLVMGLPGTGKSTLARELAQRADLHVVRTDEVRRQLAASATPADYSPAGSDRVYAACLELAAERLGQGDRVAIDANFRTEARRQPFRDLARSLRVPAIELTCTAPEEVVRGRLARRRGDASEADWAVYLAVRDEWQGPAADIVIDTTAADAVSRALTMLRESVCAQ